MNSVFKSVCRYVQICVHMVAFGWKSWLNEIPDRYAGQADVRLRSFAEVDGVPVQADVFQRVPDVVKVVQVAECVLVHHLDVVSLRQ